MRMLARRTRSVFGGAVLVAIAASVAAQNGVHPLSGRRYAQTMGVEGAEWLDRSERDQEEEPDHAIDVLKLQKGATVADIGAGSGYMTEKLSKKVGPTGKVYASDIQQGMIDLLERRIKSEQLTNMTTVLGGMDDPKLPPKSIDLAIMVDVYHELQAPQVFLQRLKAAFKPGGRLVLLEYRKEDPQIPIQELHKMSIAEVKQELEAEGYVLDKVMEVLPWQHIIVLRAN
jgi:ubiquinone/menaquinone biosynthesis C-methylase UbiE